MAKFQKTKMMTRYIIKLVIRVSIFISMFLFYLWNKPLMCELMTYPILQGIDFGELGPLQIIKQIGPIHLLWMLFMLIMILHIFPTEKLSMALRKSKEEHFQPVENYSQLELLKFVQNMNGRAWIVMLIWLSFNAIFGVLYLLDILDNADMLMLTVFFFLCDYICILFFCPFQTYIMKNRCCVNCRIYDWGHFMMFTPMLFIKNFFSWSLFFTSLVVLIHWELIYAKHPERFWFGSNKTIQCANCKDKTCQIKKAIKKGSDPL